MRIGLMALGGLSGRRGKHWGNQQSEEDGLAHLGLLSRITARPEVFGAKPIVRGMRISVERVLSLLAIGMTPDAIVEDHPGLEVGTE